MRSHPAATSLRNAHRVLSTAIGTGAQESKAQALATMLSAADTLDAFTQECEQLRQVAHALSLLGDTATPEDLRALCERIAQIARAK